MRPSDLLAGNCYFSVDYTDDRFSILALASRLFIDVGIPLSMVGDDDGRLNFRVIAASYLGGNAFTAILDFMPDRGAAGIVVR